MDNQTENTKIPIWLWIFAISILITVTGIGISMVFYWFDFATHNLLLSSQKQFAVVYVAFAVIFTLLILLGVYKHGTVTDPVRRQNILCFSICFPLSWALFYVAHALRYMAELWRLAPWVYLSIAMIACCGIAATYTFQYKISKGRSCLVLAIVYGAGVLFFGWRLVRGEVGLFSANF